ncbi:hypothetical protein HMI54_008731 [Coelomomyces lativittatus]|nr:hypothetical protein HMI55_000883 [Coelomomyces lativittatus]KAJ1516627.1 hypothetical protein HMI54_008731 [Coelomomyces lativittatus]
MDSRIGSKYLNASIGFGGSCFKKDILNLVYMAEQLHLSEVATYWNQVLIMNEHQTSRFTTRIFHRLNQTLRGKHIAVLGFAFKKNTGDTRDSAAIPLCKFFYEEGAVVHIYDPKVSLHQLRLDFDERILTPQGPSFESICLFSNLDVYAMVNGVEALVICTEWDEFKFLDYEKIYDMMKKPSYLFDGRLLLDHKVLRQIGFHVECIGKPQFL